MIKIKKFELFQEKKMTKAVTERKELIEDYFQEMVDKGSIITYKYDYDEEFLIKIFFKDIYEMGDKITEIGKIMKRWKLQEKYPKYEFRLIDHGEGPDKYDPPRGQLTLGFIWEKEFYYPPER